MRITVPHPDSRVRLDEIDLADAALYTSGEPHLVLQTLRKECPVFWQEQPGKQGFWAVTRRADVYRVLAEHQVFTSEQGTAIAMLGAPDPAAGLMMQSSDPPRHQHFREQLNERFSVRAAHSYREEIRAFVRQAIAPALDEEIWDAAKSFTRLPMAVAAMMMKLPETDVDPLLRLAFASLAPMDPHYSSGSGKVTAIFAHYDIIEYFRKSIAERQNNLSGDLLSHLITVEINGSRMTEEELLLNCLSLLLGAVVTTSQAISATLISLAETHGGEGRWPEVAHVRTAAEEALRWSSPVTHFMRCARHDTEIRGTRIRAGDAVTAWIASANRDEDTFEEPYKLDLNRFPNRHIAFGSGPHRCLGANLARMMLQESLDELIASIDSFELAGEPCHLVSNEVAGIVELPVRAKPRSR
jgi:cytochrome P450